MKTLLQIPPDGASDLVVARSIAQELRRRLEAVTLAVTSNHPRIFLPWEDTTDVTQDPEAAGSALFSVFPLKTLRDIFDLPTFEQMETCLDELQECMMQARATNDLMVALVNEKGHDVKKAFEWPEVLEWKDDGKGEVATQYGGPDGKVMMEMRVSKSPENDKSAGTDASEKTL